MELLVTTNLKHTQKRKRKEFNQNTKENQKEKNEEERNTGEQQK